MRKRFFAAFAATIMAFMTVSAATMVPVDGYPDFALGADLSSLTQLQREGNPIHYRSDVITDYEITSVVAMARDLGLDAVRLRVWVDPNEELALKGFKFKIGNSTWESISTNGYCDAADMVKMARAFAMQGLRVMVVFQMSDTWADPARQFIPAAWSTCTTADELKQKAVDHVTEVLNMLKEADVNVAWVQIGNETNSGMMKCLLPAKSGDAVTYPSWGCTIGSDATTTRNFVEVFKACAKAAKAIYPQTKTMVHLADGNNWSKVNYTLTQLKNQGFDTRMCDLVGLSLYPCSDSYTANWLAETEACVQTVKNIYATFYMRSIIAEVGMNNEWSLSTPAQWVTEMGEQAANIKQCNEDMRALTEYLIKNLRSNNFECDGLFYWEAGSDYLNSYTKGGCYSITPGPAWSRSYVTAGPYWHVCAENSTFPAGGLTQANSAVEQDVKVYVCGDFNNWDKDNPVVAHYAPNTGLYSVQVDCTGDNNLGLSVALATGAEGFANTSMVPLGTIENGVTMALGERKASFEVPYPAVWNIVVNPWRRTVNFSTTTAATELEVTPGDFADICLYYYDNADNFVSMTTTDGIVYSLTGFAAAQWFNFKVVTRDWRVCLGNAAITPGTEAVLNNNNDYFAWTTEVIGASDYWWYRNDTHAFMITHDANCPWEVSNQPSTGEPKTTYKVTFDNTLGWSKVYAFVTDAAGVSLSGVWPGKLLDAVSRGASVLTLETTGTPATIMFSDGLNSTASMPFKVDEIYNGVDAPSAEAVEMTDAPIEYYNLQGMRIAQPVEGQLCIRRQGGKAAKVIMR